MTVDGLGEDGRPWVFRSETGVGCSLVLPRTLPLSTPVSLSPCPVRFPLVSFPTSLSLWSPEETDVSDTDQGVGDNKSWKSRYGVGCHVSGGGGDWGVGSRGPRKGMRFVVRG